VRARDPEAELPEHARVRQIDLGGDRDRRLLGAEVGQIRVLPLVRLEHLVDGPSHEGAQDLDRLEDRGLAGSIGTDQHGEGREGYRGGPARLHARERLEGGPPAAQ
jgi:hypothetical protein